MKRFLRAYSEAIHQFMTQREQALAVYARRLKVQNPKVLDETYQYYAGKFSMPPRLKRDGLENALSLMRQGVSGAKAEIDIDQFVDESLLDELDREGFFKNLASRSTAR